MKSVFISDIHIKSLNDKGAKIFVGFCKHDITKGCDHVFFLGDIFDFLVGEHREYLSKYEFFFQEIASMLNRNQQVSFIEGNHDYHFSQIFLKYIKEHAKHPENLNYLKKGKIHLFGNDQYFVGHGHEVDYDNQYFKRWYKIYSSTSFEFLSSKILSFKMVEKIGAWATKNSRHRGEKHFYFQEMKRRYINGAKNVIKDLDVKGVICGHTHICEFYTFQDGKSYMNVGFPQSDKHFLFFNGDKFEKISL